MQGQPIRERLHKAANQDLVGSHKRNCRAKAIQLGQGAPGVCTVFLVGCRKGSTLGRAVCGGLSHKEDTAVLDRGWSVDGNSDGRGITWRGCADGWS